MMERLKGMLVGFGLIIVALGTKTIISEVQPVVAGLAAIVLLVGVPPLFNHRKREQKQLGS